ncbi:MAG: extracellular solute-binding protein family 1 [Paenibacillus sp.]|nr:extracellular solute-binding protein family 1 [Paenibacillus sp.]
MRKKHAGWLLALMLIVVAPMLEACGANQNESGNNERVARQDDANGGETPKQTQKEEVPIELVLYGSGFNEEGVMSEYGNPIMKKFPHIKVKFVRVNNMEEFVASGATMDIQLSVGFQMAQNVLDFGLAEDLSELVKKRKYDIGPLNTQAMEYVKMMGSGKLYGLPVMLYYPALYYNKDLFDKFGIDYPNDWMTWDDTYELAKKMTRQDGGIQYRGLLVAFQALTVQNQLSLGYLDPKTHAALFATENRWKTYVDTLTRAYRIPGNEVDQKSIQGGALNSFFYKDQTAAMFATGATTGTFASYPGLNWDAAALPSFAELPGISSSPGMRVFSVSSRSKHKEQSFEVLAYLTSREFQLWQSKMGTVTVLSNDRDIQDAFGQDVDLLKGKHIQAMNPAKPASPAASTKYDHMALPRIIAQMNRIAANETDLNTALRAAAEETDKAVQTAKSK